MTLCNILAVSLLPPPSLATAHNFISGWRVVPVGIAGRGEPTLDKDRLSYKNWNGSQLMGKMRAIQHIANRPSAKERNAGPIGATKAAGFLRGRYRITIIINIDDAIPDIDMFVRSGAESNKKLFPWSQSIVDSDGLVCKAW